MENTECKLRITFLSYFLIFRTGKPHAIVHESHVNNLRERMEREWNTMRWLSRPYLDKQQIKPYQEINGNFLEEIKTKKEADKLRKMPGEPKILNEKGEPSKAYANYGNLLHKSRSVEDSFQHLINRTRWD